MKKILGILFCFFFIFLLLKPLPVNATTFTVEQSPKPLYEGDILNLTFTADQDNYFQSSNIYSVGFWEPGRATHESPTFATGTNSPRQFQILNNNRSLKLSIKIQGSLYKTGTWYVKLWLGAPGESTEKINSGFLVLGKYTVNKRCFPNCPNMILDNSKFLVGSTTNVYLYNIEADKDYTLWYEGERGKQASGKFSQSQITTITVLGTTYPNGASLSMPVGTQLGEKTLCLTQATTLGDSVIGFSCDANLPIEITKDIPPPLTVPYQGYEYAPPPKAPTPPPTCIEGLSNPDDPTSITNDRRVIVKCTKVSTGLGVIFPTNPAEFVQTLFGVLLSLAGGIALILIIISGYRLMSSGGNPERVQAAKDQLTSAIVGLLFVIFSLSILQIIGVDILQIPGLSR